MKTPIQEFYEFMEQHQYFIGNDLYEKYKELLKKEKQTIIDAVDYGTSDWGSYKNPEEYFNKTFNTKEK